MTATLTAALRDHLTRNNPAAIAAALEHAHAVDIADALRGLDDTEFVAILLAAASAPLITSIADAAGVLIYFAIATSFLPMPEAG